MDDGGDVLRGVVNPSDRLILEYKKLDYRKSETCEMTCVTTAALQTNRRM